MPSAVRAAAYCRYSSELQRDGYSIEAQKMAIRKYAEERGYELVAFYIDEARSASKAVERRVEFQRMVSDSSEGAFSVVVVHKLDRFARNRADAAVYRRILRDNGVRLESVLERIQDGPEGIIMEGMLDSLAEYYSANLSRETKKGQTVAASKGMVLGQVPLGYLKAPDGRYAIDESRAPLVREVFSRVAGGEPLVDVSRSLISRGEIGKRGEPLSYNALRKMVMNPLYRGDHLYGGRLYEGVAPAIVDPSTFALANEKITVKKKGRAQPKVREPYALTGLLVCGLCGSPMVGWSAKARDGSPMRYYRCSGSAHGSDPFRNKERCAMRVIRADALEEQVMLAIERLCLEPNDGLWGGLAEAMNERIRAMADGAGLDELNASKSDLEKRQGRLLDAYLAGAIDLEVFRARKLGLEAELSRVASEIAKRSGEIPAEVDGETVRAAYLYYFERNKNAAGSDRATFFRVFIDYIVVYADKIEFFFKNKKEPASVMHKHNFGGAELSSVHDAIPYGFLLAFAFRNPARGAPLIGDVAYYRLAPP